MASLKEAHRSAALAFSPNASYLAAGTVAGAIDMSFSTTSTLEVGLAGPAVYPEDLMPTTDTFTYGVASQQQVALCRSSSLTSPPVALSCL